jgi:hypothetical protein
MATSRQSYHSDDIVVWPDGTWAALEEVRNGELAHMSDDYEIVRLDDVARLNALGLAEGLGLA